MASHLDLVRAAQDAVPLSMTAVWVDVDSLELNGPDHYTPDFRRRVPRRLESDVVKASIATPPPHGPDAWDVVLDFQPLRAS